MDPLNLINENCWRHLFKFLSAEDKQALCDTCGTFQAMFQPQKTKWSFELILPHILKEFSSRIWYYDPNKKTITSVLELRLVCKSWRAGFDKYCGTYYYLSGLPLIDDIVGAYAFDYAPELENFLTFFKDYDGNPFIGGQVCIYAVSSRANEPVNQEENSQSEAEEGNAASEGVGMDEEEVVNEEDEDIEIEEEVWSDEEEIGMEEEEDVNDIDQEVGIEEDDGIDEDEDEEYDDYDEEEDEDWLVNERTRIRMERDMKLPELNMELLSKYGKEISNLHLGRSDNCQALDAYKILQIALCNCPNLQILDMTHFHGDLKEEASISGFQNSLSEYFEMNHLPTMHSLRELILPTMNALVENLMLEAYGSNLQTLRISNASEIPVSIWSKMNCLQDLTLYNYTFEQAETLLRALKSPLQRLTVIATCGILSSDMSDAVQTDKFFKIDKFLLAIQHLPLKRVYIRPESRILKESAPFPADFPKHETILEFYICTKVFSFNFLRFLPNLQSFFVNGARCLMTPSPCFNK